MIRSIDHFYRSPANSWRLLCEYITTTCEYWLPRQSLSNPTGFTAPGDAQSRSKISPRGPGDRFWQPERDLLSFPLTGLGRPQRNFFSVTSLYGSIEVLDQLPRTPLARTMPSDGLRTTFCRFLCMSWHLHVLAPRVCILVVRAHQDRSVRNEGHSPTKYDHREGSEGRERHVRRSARFFFPRRSS